MGASAQCGGHFKFIHWPACSPPVYLKIVTLQLVCLIDRLIPWIDHSFIVLFDYLDYTVILKTKHQLVQNQPLGISQGSQNRSLSYNCLQSTYKKH